MLAITGTAPATARSERRIEDRGTRRVITALIGRKGGIGKTTICVNLAAGLADLGYRVLLLDLDSQASASRSLGVPRAELAPSSADVLGRGVPVRAALRATTVPRLDLLTASADLAGIDIALATMGSKEHRLRNALATVRADYDYIFIDCPPSQSLLTINALVAADRILIPVVPQFLAVEGVQNLLSATARLRESTGARVQPLGIALSMVDYRLKLTREIVGALRNEYGALVFGIEIRVNVRLAEAPAYGQTIFQHDPSAPGAKVLSLFCDEFLMRTNAKPPLAQVPQVPPVRAESIEPTDTTPEPAKVAGSAG